MKNIIVPFNEVEVPQELSQTRKTGITPLDTFLSRDCGLVPGTAYMFTGEAGAGKTTISNYIMSGVSLSNRNPAVFVSMEMSKEQAKKQFGGKVDFSNTLIVDQLPDSTFEGFLELLQAIELQNPSVLVVDSLQAVSDRTGADTSDVVMAIITFAKKTFCPSIIITQNNKAGDFAGASKVLYYVDAHLDATIDKKTGVRSLTYKKDRNGNTGMSITYKFDEQGHISFVKEGSKEHTLLSATFSWHKSEDMVKDLFSKILKDELETMLKRGNTIPQLVTGSLYEGKYFLMLDVHSNTIYAHTDYCRQFFNDDHIDNLHTQFADFKDYFPEFQKPHELFYLAVISSIVYGVLNSTDHNKRFWDTMSRVIRKLS